MAQTFHCVEWRTDWWPIDAHQEKFISTAVGGPVSWNVDAQGHVFQALKATPDSQDPHLVIDRAGVEWSVCEVTTPQSWAHGARCLILNSRECVRRLWEYPPNWRSLDADVLLRLGTAD